MRLNRGSARRSVSAEEPAGFEAVRSAHQAVIAPTTLASTSPVIELDRPIAGIYAGSRRGIYLDLYLGVAQRLFDDDRIRPLMEPLFAAGLALRREINTDDYLGFAPTGVAMPQDLARIVVEETARAWPRLGGYRAFFSNSGTEAVEAAIKASALAAYRRFVIRHGIECWAAVCTELGIERDRGLGSSDLWMDYPLFFIGLEGAFHGRSLGSLSLTRSRPVQRIGFPRWRWARHVPPRDGTAVERLIERRPIGELLAEPGALAEVVAEGRIPGELLAAAIIEPFQGEGGYRAPALDVLQALRASCDRFDAMLIVDEVQTFARGGRTFFSELRGIRPDIVCLAKAAVVGTTVIPGDLVPLLEPGWHSNTFGSGRLFDVNYAYAVWSTFLATRDPLFWGLSFAENEAVKGAYFAERFERLSADSDGFFGELDGAGCIWGFTVPDRGPFIDAGWRQGAKLLGAGAASRPGRVRLIFPADILTKEVDDVIDALRATWRATVAGATA